MMTGEGVGDGQGRDDECGPNPEVLVFLAVHLSTGRRSHFVSLFFFIPCPMVLHSTP